MQERPGLSVVKDGKLTAAGQIIRRLIWTPMVLGALIFSSQMVVEESFAKLFLVLLLAALQIIWMFYPSVPIRTFAVIAWIFRQ